MKDTLFQGLLKPITHELVSEGVARYDSDYDCETLTTLTHLKALIYAQLNELNSLRTLEVAINSRIKHLGITHKISRSTLSDANGRRESAVFFWILDHLMVFFSQKTRQEIQAVVKILDSSPIKLKGRGFDEWVKSSATGRWQGLKLHVEYDLLLKTPSKVAMSPSNYNDSSMAQGWAIHPKVIYVFDKGYCDFNWWWSIHQKGAYFVTRLKKNTAFIMKECKIVNGDIIKEDGTFTFKNKRPRGGKVNLYTKELRRISVNREGKKPLILVTNLHALPAETIAEMYKARWDIELFFKWIKQNLKIKKFLGRTANAVKIQLAVALITYLLVQILKTSSQDARSLRLVLTWLRVNLHIPLPAIIRKQSPPFYSSLYLRPGLNS